MNLPPEWIEVFKQQRWHTVHWSEIGDPRASDSTIMAWARDNGYIVFTRDLDFGTLLATTDVDGPSVIQVRCKDIMPMALGELLVNIIHQHEQELINGVLLTVTEEKIRLRTLPFRNENT